MSLAAVPSEQPGATCTHCGAALVADQRYCLSCGQAASPVRLAFLDVLQNDQIAAAGTPSVELLPAGYAPRRDDARGANEWLRRNSGLLGLLTVLVLCLIAGLLVGHWASQGKESTARQVVEVKGLSGLAATPAATAPTASPSVQSGATKPTVKEAGEAKEAEAKETAAEKAPPPKPKKVTPEKIKKLTTSSGAQHQKEINELGAQPIETG